MNESCTFSTNKAWDGVLYAFTSTLTIEASEFHDNVASKIGVLYLKNSSVTIETSEFSANKGGVLYLFYCSIKIKASEFHDNIASVAGVIYLNKCSVTIETSEVSANTGSIFQLWYCSIKIKASEFYDNVDSEFGVFYLVNSSMAIEASESHDNTGSSSSLLFSINSNMTIEGSIFYRNRAIELGGVLSFQYCNVTVGNCNFTDNSSPRGAVIFADENTKIQYHNHLLIDKNSGSALIYLSGSEFRGNDSGNFIFSNNNGSLLAINSNVNFSGYIKFVNNQSPKFNKTTDTVQEFEGGAITLFQSNIIFIDGNCRLEHNHAENGGAIHSTESRL